MALRICVTCLLCKWWQSRDEEATQTGASWTQQIAFLYRAIIPHPNHPSQVDLTAREIPGKAHAQLVPAFLGAPARCSLAKCPAEGREGEALEALSLQASLGTCKDQHGQMATQFSVFHSNEGHRDLAIQNLHPLESTISSVGLKDAYAYWYLNLNRANRKFTSVKVR